MGRTLAYVFLGSAAICVEGTANGFGDEVLDELPCVEVGLGGAFARKTEISSEAC